MTDPAPEFLCVEKNLYYGEKYTYAGYTVRIFTITFPTSCTITIWDPDMQSLGTVVLKIGNPEFQAFAGNVLKFSVKTTAVGENNIGGSLQKFVTLRLCGYTTGDGGVEPPIEPPPTGGGTGPDITECVFPELSLNFISVMSGLAQWLGCMIRNIIILMKWVVDWILHFPDHLDAWISRLFGIDPALPFFDELMRKIDVYISARLGVDSDKPILDELAKKILAWFFSLLDSKADDDSQKRGW